MTALDPRRSTVLTGSDLVVLMGAVPESWGTPYEVYLHKVGLGGKTSTSHRMAMGHIAEPYIAYFYQEELPPCFELERGQFQQHPMFPFGGTPDRMVLDADGKVVKGLEIKKVGHKDGWGDSGTDQVPMRVYVQCQHYMLVTGEKEWDVAALIEEDSYRVYHLKRDDAFIDRMISVGMAFWTAHVIPKVPPSRGAAEPDGLLAFAKAGDAVIDPDDPEVLELGAQANKLKATAEKVNQALDATVKALKERMIFKNYKGVSITGGWSAMLIGMNFKPKTDWEKVALGMEDKDPAHFKALMDAHTSAPPPTTQFRFKAKPRPDGSEE